MKMNKLSKLNITVLLKIVSLLGFSAFFIFSIINGSFSMYINPKNLPFLIFAIIAMVVVSFFLVGDLFLKQYKKNNSLWMLFFIVPIFMAFFIPAQSFDSSSRSAYGASITGGAAVLNSSQQTVSEDDGIEYGSRIILDDRNFSVWLDLIYRNSQKYVGREIELVGFVYKDDNYFEKNQFAAARMMMVCCAADMQMTGFICSYDKLLGYENDTWVKINGIIDITQMDDEKIPIIVVDSIKETQKPKEDYIYPNY